MRILGVDLAWGEGSASKAAHESGVVAVDLAGKILDAGWTCGIAETVAWLAAWAEPDTLAMVDAPLMVQNTTGQRLCEKQVGQRYWPWGFSANTTNLSSPRLAGVRLREHLEDSGWHYDDGRSGPPSSGRIISEVYPYTTIVGAFELGYEAKRPTYKRKPKSVPIGQFRPIRAAACDGLLAAMARLATANPPLDLQSHPVTAKLLEESSPLAERDYKHREDLLDAALCAWTGLLWLQWGFERCQVLGLTHEGTLEATIIAPARDGQRGAGGASLLDPMKPS
jgi:predicted RNase H-like nuclease